MAPSAAVPNPPPRSYAISSSAAAPPTSSSPAEGTVRPLAADVVFSTYNTPALGTSLDEGPFRDSRLAEGYRKAMATNSVDTVVTTDIESWAPA